jgi:multiple sugar transport system substrate-binding protein
MAMTNLDVVRKKFRKEDFCVSGKLPGPKGTPELGAWLLAIPENSGEKERAWEFLQYATRQTEIRRAAVQGNPPPRRSVLTDPSLQEIYWTFPFQLESLTNARPRPRTPRWKEIENRLGIYLSELYAGAISVDRVMKQVKCELEAIQQ